MNKYWVSWYHYSDMGDFEFKDDNPCWESGYLHADDVREDRDPNVDCAYIYKVAVKAKASYLARQAVFKAYEQETCCVDFRFTIKKPDDWSPFCERFPRADWMVWE